MKTTIKRRQGFTLVELLVVIIIIASLAALSAPMLIRNRKKADMITATSNAKQIGLALFDFDSQYSSYPDATTAAAVTTATNSPLTLTGSSSNDMFRQLIAAGISQSEEMFYAKTPYTKKADNVYNSAGTALAAGENGFGYLMNGTVGFSSSGNPSRPIAVTPLFNAATDGTFDPDPFDTKGIVLRIDNSAVTYTIRTTDKKLVIQGAKTLLDTGADTVWDTTTNPTILAPTKKS